jgi:hypothetical protein
MVGHVAGWPNSNNARLAASIGRVGSSLALV